MVLLFAAFFKIGLFSFGGGYAMIPLLRETALSAGWLTEQGFADMVAVSQVTPGPIAVNMATFVGFREAGFAGALAATVGVCSPSFVLVTVVMAFMKRFNGSKAVESAFAALRPAVAGIIAAACVNVLMPEIFKGAAWLDGFDARALVLFIAAFVVVYRFKVNMIIVILLSALAGIILYG